ncbi:MAG: TPR repeat protein, partial [Verrucomicrobiales bacterium]
PEVVLKSLEVISSWDVAPKAGLLRAKIRMPASTAQGDFAAALREFHDAIKLDPESAKALQSELEATTAAMVRSFSAEWRLDRQIEILESIQQLPAGMVFNSDADPRLLRQCVLAEELRNQGQPLEALVAVLSLTDSPSQWFPTVEQQSIRYIADVAKLDFEQREKALGLISGKSTSNSGQSDFFRDAVEPIVASIAAGPMKDAGNALELFRETAREAEGWDVILKPRVSEILAKLKPAAAEDLDGVASELVETAEFWKLGAAYVILATHEGDTNTGFNYWLKAEEFGDIDSKAAVGRMLVRFGQSDADLKAGLLKVQEAAEADNRNGLFELGCFYRDGTGVAIDLPKSIELLTRADTAGHPDAKFQLGLAEALQGMETNSKEAFESAVANFNAIAAAKPHAYYWLYVCYITPELNDLDKAREALEEGANQADPKSLHALGLALLSGSAPFKENVSVGREHMLKAGLAGVVDAGKWCIKEEERINRDGTEDERAWVVRNKEAIAKFRD